MVEYPFTACAINLVAERIRSKCGVDVDPNELGAAPTELKLYVIVCY